MSGNQAVYGNDVHKECSHYFLTMSSDESITFCNTNFSGRFLADPSNTISFSGIVSEADLLPFREAFNTCISTPGTCVNGTSKFINQHNETHHVKWEMVAEAKPGTDHTIYLVGYDCYETHGSENEIERSRRILKAIFDSTSNVKFFVSPDFRIQFFNKKAYENGIALHGTKMKVGDNILDYARDTENNIDQAFLTDFDRAINGERVVRESKIKYKTNKELWFRSEYNPVYENNQLVGVSVTVLDITEQKTYEESISLQNEKLHKIAFIQSHQVRQPLSNILGILSFFNTDGLSDDDKYLIKLLELSSKQLDSVIRQIVMEAQLIEHEKEVFDNTFKLHKI